MSLAKFIRSDLYRYTGSTSNWRVLVEYFRNAGFRYSFWFRVSQSPHVLLRTVGRLFKKHYSVRYLINIPVEVSIGYGLYLSAHPMAIVINPTAVIGNNCNLSQFTTIGANDGQAATIGDNVYIGPGVSLVESVRIGSNATIGAGAIVVKDVPENATVAGNPARVISWKTPARYILNRYEPDNP